VSVVKQTAADLEQPAQRQIEAVNQAVNELVSEVVIASGGDARCLYAEWPDVMRLGRSLGEVRVRRGGRVEPDGRGAWWADLSPVGGPALGPFPTRSEAVAAEVDWLGVHWLLSQPDRRPLGRNGGVVRLMLCVLLLVAAFVLVLFVGCLDRQAAVRRSGVGFDQASTKPRGKEGPSNYRSQARRQGGGVVAGGGGGGRRGVPRGGGARAEAVAAGGGG